MTDAQGFAIFKCLLEYMVAQRNLPEGTQLDLRPFIEPTIDRMLDDAKKQGRVELKEKLVEFAGSKRTIATADLLRFLAG